MGYFDLVSGGTVYFTAATLKPGLTGVSPGNGPTAGGTLVTLTGSNFVSGLTVRFAGVPAQTVNFSNSTLVTASTPANAAGSVDVTLINPDGQWTTLANGFSYSGGGNPPPTAPTLRSIALVGGSIVLVSSGATNGISRLFSSTDLTAAITSWTSLATNNVGSDGLFTNTLPLAPGEAQRFYRLAIPYAP
jgi:hypothetical protein